MKWLVKQYGLNLNDTTKRSDLYVYFNSLK